MKLSAIKPTLWYETKLGIGQCLSTGGTHPPSAQFRIIAPIPRGVVSLAPRDVFSEVEPPPNPR